MSWFQRREHRPEAMEWGSSFAEAEVATRQHRHILGAGTYDPRMAYEPPTDQTPIGSRRRDVPIPRPEAFGSAPPPKRRTGIARRLMSIVLLLAALLLLGGLVWGVLSFSGSSDVEAGTPVTVVIPNGASSTDIAEILAKAGVVTRESVFRARLKLNGDGSQFRSGTYKMKTGASYDTIIRTLERGPAPAPTYHLTIPEGQRVEETAALIDEMRASREADGASPRPAFTGAQYLAAVKAQRPPATLKAPARTTSMEGLLFPATYDLRVNATAEDFVAKQREAFDENLAQLNMARAKKANLTPYDVVIIASLIEREARLDKERPLVAAVIWNRLKIGEPLGIDAANQYSVYVPGSGAFWITELKQSDLDKESPYNLRKVAGLPPTPIAAPSRKSLEAAAAPANVDYRYYVAKKDESGEHFFTADYDEFLRHS